MKKNYIIIFLISFHSCIIDTFKHVFDIKNNSEKNVRILFSNNGDIDSLDFDLNYKILLSGATSSTIYNNHFFNKNEYINSEKKLYMFVLNNDSLLKYSRLNLNKQVVLKRTFIVRKKINLLKIKENDTISID